MNDPQPHASKTTVFTLFKIIEQQRARGKGYGGCSGGGGRGRRDEDDRGRYKWLILLQLRRSPDNDDSPHDSDRGRACETCKAPGSSPSCKQNSLPTIPRRFPLHTHTHRAKKTKNNRNDKSTSYTEVDNGRHQLPTTVNDG